ncbi:MAG: biotin synthase BioB [Leptospiraceae bacterium]|nr:biotin synthase BioB [Leptospiraceae bacterium]MCB1170293.1 biotin synthase BioB [Leptospiraceae bacterium]
MSESFLDRFEQWTKDGMETQLPSPEPTPEEGMAILTNAPLERILDLGQKARFHYFGNRVRAHILNNIKNGNCPEDCGYCAQRRTAEGIPQYTLKPAEEILEEARAAKSNGAFRYCLVTAGRGPSRRQIQAFADVIRQIKGELGMEVCLSAGILTDAESASILQAAGLDRYNHNLNSSEEHYGEICQSHTYADRLKTLENLNGHGVHLCSGVIAGMGESDSDLIQVALELRRLGVVSIPVNFFLPVPGHAIENPRTFSEEQCLRILALFRLANPSSEVRIAAGREHYLKTRQADALRVANSLFISGYLNVKGSDASATAAMIAKAGFEMELSDGEAHGSMIKGEGETSEDLSLKDLADLRPFAEK